MKLDDLKNKIEKKEARIAVIGLGYVGLPVACSFARAGFQVQGIDIVEDRVSKINSGISTIEGIEPGLTELLAEVSRNGKLRASTEYANLAECDLLLISVETPVDAENKPRYEALRACLTSLERVLKDGALIIVESTIAPGTMNKVVTPILENNGKRKLNIDFFLGHCPERVMPGKLLSNLASVSRVVGGRTPETALVMVSLYRNIIPKADLDTTDCTTAELVKTTENAYRDAQIAFANEIALICEAVGADVWNVRELVNKSPGRHMLMPGAGVGGHCIPKDPWLLAYGAIGTDLKPRLIPAARDINNSMPGHITALLEKALKQVGRELKDTSVLVLGYSYLEDSDDTRNSPSEILVRSLNEKGAKVIIHDPFVDGFLGDVLMKAKRSDAAILMVKHSYYVELGFRKLADALKTPIIIDGRGAYREAAEAEDVIYYGIGIGKSLEQDKQSP
ncbi:MAG: nucleotide sugar dehydrogenase [Anaerolineales bacterium]